MVFWCGRFTFGFSFLLGFFWARRRHFTAPLREKLSSVVRQRAVRAEFRNLSRNFEPPQCDQTRNCVVLFLRPLHFCRTLIYARISFLHARTTLRSTD